MADEFRHNPLTAQELSKFFVTTAELLTIWSSDEVVRAYSKIRSNFVDPSDAMQGLLLLAELMRAIRRDLGHSNAGFRTGTLLGVFVTDVDQSLARRVSVDRAADTESSSHELMSNEELM